MCVSLDGTSLLLEADCAPLLELLDALQRDKPEILTLLQTGDIGQAPSSVMTTKSLNLHGLMLAELEGAAGDD